MVLGMLGFGLGLGLVRGGELWRVGEEWAEGRVLGLGGEPRTASLLFWPWKGGGALRGVVEREAGRDWDCCSALLVLAVRSRGGAMGGRWELGRWVRGALLGELGRLLVVV